MNSSYFKHFKELKLYWYVASFLTLFLHQYKTSRLPFFSFFFLSSSGCNYLWDTTISLLKQKVRLVQTDNL